MFVFLVLGGDLIGIVFFVGSVSVVVVFALSGRWLVSGCCGLWGCFVVVVFVWLGLCGGLWGWGFSVCLSCGGLLF